MTKQEFDKLSPNDQKKNGRWLKTATTFERLSNEAFAIAKAEGRPPVGITILLTSIAQKSDNYSTAEGVRKAIKKVRPELLTNYRAKYAELKKQQSINKRVVSQ